MNSAEAGSGRVRVGIVGTGVISGAYLQGLPAFSDVIDVVALADLDRARAHARAAEFDIARVLTPAELFASPDVDLVVDLTIPAAHAEVTLAALAAGKAVYGEKPLAADPADGHRLTAAAAAAGLALGCAPDTVLGAGLQTCRRLLDEGVIGRPVGATATMLCPGHEGWHPDPAFYYRAGGGPVLDMGPYYVSALVHLLGPVATVSGAARATHAERTVGSGPRAGERFAVEVDTHATAALRFVDGPVVSLSMSFDVWRTAIPPIELYGTEGTLWVPDPNRSAGAVRYWRGDETEAVEVPLDEGWTGGRGVGVVDVALAMRSGGVPVGSGAVAAHVLDVLDAVTRSSADTAVISLATDVQRPPPFVCPPIRSGV